MLSAWANQTLEKLPSFEPQGVSNTAWAFARLGFHSPQLFQAVAAAALHRLDGFTAQACYDTVHHRLHSVTALRQACCIPGIGNPLLHWLAKCQCTH